MAMLSAFPPAAAASTFCRPEEDPFLLLESTLRSEQEILIRRRGLPQRRVWIEFPYGEEEITRLEEEVLQSCLERIAEIDAALEAQQEAEMASIEAERAAALQLVQA